MTTAFTTTQPAHSNRPSRRRAAAAAALAALALLSPAAALAQAAGYPNKAIKLVVPYAPGGSAGIAARLVTDEWGKALGGSLFIENKGGAGGNIGVDMVAKAQPDGYTIGLQTVSLAINPALTAKMPYDTLKDLAPIGMVASSQHVLVVNNAVPAKNLKELLALLKAKPGQYSYGSAGPGSTFHMSAELFKAVAGTPIVHIPYRGGGPAMIDTMSGQVAMSFPVLSAVQPHVQAGKLRAPGRYRHEALGADARCAHHCRGRPAGLRLRNLVHRVRAGWHAPAHHRQAQRLSLIHI